VALLASAACFEGAPPDPAGPIQLAPGGGGAPIQVTATDPTIGGLGATLDVRVLGLGFVSGAKVDFLLNGSKTPGLKTNSNRFVSANEVVANITIAPDAVLDLYDVQVTVAGKKPGVGIELFQVCYQGPPGQCDPPLLDITFGQGMSGTDALRGDDADNTMYPGQGHISGNGNLMFWLGENNPRFVSVTTTGPFNGGTRNRIFTNNHTNPGGDNASGLLGMVEGSSGTAVLEAELHVQSSDPYQVVRYGKDCGGTGSGGGAVVAATKVGTTRLGDGRTWTITGTSGVHCKQVGKKPGLTQVGTAGPFSMTLVWP
jgi:hypothetical protein